MTSKTSSQQHLHTPISKKLAALIGVVAVGIGIGVAELLSGLSAALPSLVVAVGDGVIEAAPSFVQRWAIDTLGTADKPALIIGTVILTLLVGALAGISARKSFFRAANIFFLLGAVAFVASATRPQFNAVTAMLSSAAAVITAIICLYLLFAIANSNLNTQGVAAQGASASPSSEHVSPSDLVSPKRRSLIASVFAGLGIAVVLPLLGSSLRRKHAQSIAEGREKIAGVLNNSEEAPGAVLPDISGGNFDSIKGIEPLVTDARDFYRIDTALVIPQINVEDWSMKITGLVDSEIEMTFDDLLAEDLVEEWVTLSCVSNKIGGDLVGNAKWAGIPLQRLLKRAGVKPQATQILGRSVDGWTGVFPLELAQDPNRVAMVAVAMNGEPLPVIHGFPARLVVAGLYGYVSATKWLASIELVDDSVDGYWTPRGWSRLGPVKTQSRIDVPRYNARLKSGPQPIAGVAWAPSRGVEKVEVLTVLVKDGEYVPSPWQEAELSNDLSSNAWRQWYLPWQAEPGDYVLRVRATDGTGETQTNLYTPPAPNGSSGWHEVVVRVS